MYNKRFLIDEENEMFYRLKELKDDKTFALHLKGVESTLVVMTQEEYLQLKMMEDTFLTSKGLRESIKEEYDLEKLTAEFESKMSKLEENTLKHDKGKIQGVSVIEDND